VEAIDLGMGVTLARADEALYAAKANGGNRIVTVANSLLR
jgi:PleD family two-component response regulator